MKGHVTVGLGVVVAPCTCFHDQHSCSVMRIVDSKIVDIPMSLVPVSSLPLVDGDTVRLLLVRFLNNHVVENLCKYWVVD